MTLFWNHYLLYSEVNCKIGQSQITTLSWKYFSLKISIIPKNASFLGKKIDLRF